MRVLCVRRLDRGRLLAQVCARTPRQQPGPSPQRLRGVTEEGMASDIGLAGRIALPALRGGALTRGALDACGWRETVIGHA